MSLEEVAFWTDPLQWGRAQVRAEGTRAMVTSELIELLQWGRAQVRAEGNPQERDAFRRWAASMGPRAGARGRWSGPRLLE